MKALLIEFNRRTGERAGGVTTKDPALRCYGWQNLKVEPAIEIRLIEDDRDTGQYEGIPGITILEGRDVINAAVDANIPTRVFISEATLFQTDILQREISLQNIPGDTQAVLTSLNALGVKGITERKPYKL